MYGTELFRTELYGTEFFWTELFGTEIFRTEVFGTELSRTELSGLKWTGLYRTSTKLRSQQIITYLILVFISIGNRP